MQLHMRPRSDVVCLDPFRTRTPASLGSGRAGTSGFLVSGARFVLSSGRAGSDGFLLGGALVVLGVSLVVTIPVSAESVSGLFGSAL